jgi:diguanylate cyclase (GGDEF)-like protein
MATILVIEDASSLREEILQILELIGFQGLEAENGTDGIKLAQQYLPDVILCDIMLPEQDGYEVLQTLRQHPETAMIPLIFLTAKADRADIRQGMNLGADDYLTKPFTSEELHQAITARLKQRHTITEPYISEMKRIAIQLGQIAYQDPLTGLPNRIKFQHQLQQTILQAQQNQRAVGVLRIRIEQSGDQARTTTQEQLDEPGWDDSILQEIAQRLSACLAPGDMVARLGRNEFGLILTATQTQPEVTQVASRIWQALSASYGGHEPSGQPIRLHFSLGATLYPEDDGTVAQLLNHTVLAMNWGRSHGHPLCPFYGQAVEDFIAQQRSLGVDLRQALQQSELQIYYQPQINLITGRIIGSEALLRWNHPKLGWIPPKSLLSVARETGLILPLEKWVLRTVCAQVQLWQKTQILPLRVSVNLSADFLQQPNFAAQVTEILQQFQVSPDWLALELSETAMMQNVQAGAIGLQQLKDRGIFLSIDSFGAGCSYLSYLKRLPIDALKIDQSLVRTAIVDHDERSVVSTLITLAQSLNLQVIAVGVETPEQLSFLRRQGCHAMQGYLFSHPVAAADFEALLNTSEGLSLSGLNSTKMP